MDAAERELLAETLRKTMTAATGATLDAALTELGWPDLLAEAPDVAVPLVFELLGETGAQAPILNDVVRSAGGHPVGGKATSGNATGAPVAGGTVALPYAGGSRVVWERDDRASSSLDGELPLRVLAVGEAGAPLDPASLAAGRVALGWWLVGTGRAMLDLARTHALDRTQFGRPIASFQAVRHRLAETFVALDGARTALAFADDELGALLGKAAAGSAALTAARHCQQVLGGIGFTAEHDLHRHLRRAHVLDGLLGGTRELTREAGALVRRQRHAPRLAQL